MMQFLESKSAFSRVAIPLLLVCALILLLPAVHCQAENSTVVPESTTSRPPGQTSTCFKRRQNITITPAGCESNSTTIRYCTGTCTSSNTGDLSIPGLRVQACDCCQALESVVKVKKLLYRCGPNGELEERRVFIPRVRRCGCGPCFPF